MKKAGYMYECTYVCMYMNVRICVHIYIYIWADGFSGVPRISPVLGRTVSGSTFRWHLSHLFLDVFLLLVEVGINSALMTAVLKLCLRFRLYNLHRQNVNVRLLILKVNRGIRFLSSAPLRAFDFN